MKTGKKLALVGVALLTTTTAFAAGKPYAEQIHELMGLPLTNSILTSWVISLLIIVAVRMAVKQPQLVPSRGQALVENIVDGLRGMLTPIVGKHMVNPTFWLLSGLFMYIMMHNWSGLLPGVGTIGLSDGEHLTPFVRPANADLNMTLALAAVSMVAWLYYVLKYAGPGVLVHELFGNKANKGELATPVYFFLTLVFIVVGFIEVFSIMLRPVTLSFRLFGNVFGGESLLANMFYIFDWLLPVPFYFLELLVGLVQAFVFTLLVSVYIGLVCNHDGGEHH